MPNPTTGNKFQLGYRPLGGSGNFAYGTQVTKITPPKGSTDGADTTRLLADVKEDVPTIPKADAGFSYMIVDGDTWADGVRDAYWDGTILSWSIKHPDGRTKTFDAWITSFEPSELNNEDAQYVDLGLSLRTKPVYNAAPVTP